MSFPVQFGQTTKARNSTLVPTLSTTCQCLLKDQTSIVRPTFTIHLSQSGAPTFEQLSQFNYCYVAMFKRYYFITNITSFTAAVVLIDCEVDVLATFKDDILNTPAFVMYSQSRYNAQVVDGRLPMLGTSVQSCNITDIGTLFTREGVFALTAVSPEISGETGAAATILMGAVNLKQLAAKLYSDDFWESVKTELYHPEEALIACMWTPISESQAKGNGNSQIKIGKYDLYTGFNIKKTVTASFVVPFTIPHGDYRSFEPYTKYTMTLPGVGTIDVPMKLLYGNEAMNMEVLSIKVNVSASPVSGDVIYNMELMDASGGVSGNGVAYTVKGNFGVEVPISRTVGRFGSILQSVAGGVSSVIGGAAIGGPVGALGGAANFAGNMIGGLMESMNTHTNIVGSLGGWSVMDGYNIAIESKTIAYNVSDNPPNVANTIGRPLYANVSRLGVLTGFVNCVGAHVKTWGTGEELNMISSYINGSLGNPYGGFLIE